MEVWDEAGAISIVFVTTVYNSCRDSMGAPPKSPDHLLTHCRNLGGGGGGGCNAKNAQGWLMLACRVNEEGLEDVRKGIECLGETLPVLLWALPCFVDDGRKVGGDCAGKKVGRQVL